MYKVLVTGATGFLGCNVLRRCVNEGFETHILTRKDSNKWRINDILPSLHEHSGDLSDYGNLNKILQTIKPDLIFHLGAYGTHISVQRDTSSIIQANFIGTVNLIQAAKNIDYSLFVNIGSSSEYGPKVSSMAETDLLEPMSLYAITKAASTHFAQFTAKNDKKPIVTLRPFSVYGYYEEPIRLIPSTIWNCLKGREMRLSDGHNAMDFLFIDDFVNACMSLVDHNLCPAGEIINIGTGIATPIHQVVNEIVAITQSNILLRWGSLPNSVTLPKSWSANTQKMWEILKWQPKYTLHAGLVKTVAWMKENIDLYNRFEPLG